MNEDYSASDKVVRYDVSENNIKLDINLFKKYLIIEFLQYV